LFGAGLVIGQFQ